MFKKLFTKEYRSLLFVWIFVASIAIIISISAIVIAVKDKRYKAEFKQNIAIVKAEFYENESLYSGLVAAIKKVEFDDYYYICYERYNSDNIFRIKGSSGKPNPTVDPEIAAEIKSFYDEIEAKTSFGINIIDVTPKEGQISMYGNKRYRTGYRWVRPWVRPNSKTVISTIAFAYFDAIPEGRTYLETLNDNWVIHRGYGMK